MFSKNFGKKKRYQQLHGQPESTTSAKADIYCNISNLSRFWPMPNRKKPLETFAGLAKAIDWYDVSLQSILKNLGMTTVNRTQSMILIHISNGVTRPSDLEREMGTTRQNIHAMSKHLLDNQILTLISDPTDRRSKQYTFSDDAAELRKTVLKVLAYLDRQLAKRIGKDMTKNLTQALSADWHEPITEPPASLSKPVSI